MSWQYILESILNMLSNPIGTPHLTVGHIVMLLIGVMLPGLAKRSGDTQKNDAGSEIAQMPSAPALVQDRPEAEMPVPLVALPSDVAAAVGLALHLFTNGGRNLRLSDSGMKAAAVGLALHLYAGGCHTLCTSDMGKKAAAIGLAMHLQKTSGAEI